VRGDHGNPTEAGQLAGASSALQGARQDLREGQTLQPLTKAAGVALSALRQRDVGQAGVLARHRPCRLAVAGQVNDRQLLAHNYVLGQCKISMVARLSPTRERGTLFSSLARRAQTQGPL